ncbi:hypothetical protein [Gordonia sp. SL306]|uniref:hypothetical protein n=1 Tax=Gordonia sp. SL306 TaxID=2995145 RepID=UPI00226F8E44|nr:hypothetical protein [Gordonia sp. SL306]WAC54060.1 hypothetical protein OVA31_15330 [Gordonia sp. SL306]
MSMPRTSEADADLVDNDTSSDSAQSAPDIDPDTALDADVESDDAGPDAQQQTPRRGLRRVRSAFSRGRFVPIALGISTIAAVAAASTAYATVYRDDQATNGESAREAVAAANDGTVALLSYSPKSLDADLAKGQSHLTGQFLTYYKEFTAKVVKPAATENNVETKAQVVRSAVSKLSADDAEILAFVNQSTTSKTKPDPELTSSSVKVALHRVDGNWLISSFDPV